MSPIGTRSKSSLALFHGPLARRAAVDAIAKLSPRHQARNPVMFVVYVGSLTASLLYVLALADAGDAPGESSGFILAVTLWLWLTLLFANFAEALAEGREIGRAHV